jgi:hypothetical protein
VSLAGAFPDIVAHIPDLAVEAEYRRQLCREVGSDAYARGYRDGYERRARVLEVEWPQVVKPALDAPDHTEAERRRWHVCCRRCRLDGHRRECLRCEDRTRETYGDPHPDDYVPQMRLEAAS